MNAARGLVVSSLAIAALVCACNDDKPHTHQVDLGVRTMPVQGAAGIARTPAPDAGTNAAFANAAPEPAAPSDTVVQPVVPAAAPVAAPAAPKVNPDDAVLERTRVACGGCFSSLPAGAGYGPPTRSAHVSLVVIPTGSVSRADATSNDTDDPNVLACVQSTARAAVFSDNGGGPLRTYAIDVRVAAPGANGSR